ncbi:hypothetical protein PAXINDRAFT_19273 [Paxillus involutus ATCC 200175]|uniref:Uncharacterized protein n=1 Tax=Paxillus involutus ATCC 200175 TaxID=664439 RepID=A0A0C9T8S0_PAXIN|nr:hypothetical protein PAXINDRAFT_19273 [Paxillus involutus ATCC 200175]
MERNYACGRPTTIWPELSLTGTHGLIWQLPVGRRKSPLSSSERVATLNHDQYVQVIAFSRSGRLIATRCNDNKVYLREAPASKDPKTTSPARSFSSFLDVSTHTSIPIVLKSLTSVQQRPAIPQLAGPSRNDARGLDPCWVTLPNRDPRTSPQAQRVLNKVGNMFANVFTRRSAGAAQTSPVRETVEPVKVAAGRDKTFWIVVAIPHDPDDDLPAATGTNSSETTTGNAATTDQSEPAGDSVIRTQPQRTEIPAVQDLFGVEKTDRSPDPSQTPTGETVTSNQRESIEMVAFPPAITQNLLVSPPSHTPRLTSSQALLQHDHTALSAITLSPIEIAMIEEYRRRQATSAFVKTAAQRTIMMTHVHHESSTPPP